MIEVQQSSLFDYSVLDNDTRASVLQLEDELDCVLKRSKEEIGAILLKVKQCLPHGQYEPWLASKGISQPTAWRCMQIAQGKEIKSFNLNDLPVIQEAKVEIVEPLIPVTAPVYGPFVDGQDLRDAPPPTVDFTDFGKINFPALAQLHYPAYVHPLERGLYDAFSEVAAREKAVSRMEHPVEIDREMHSVTPLESPVQSRNEHVMQVMGSSDSPEWYTPQEIVYLSLEVLGEIDLDPCSNSRETPNVPARNHYTREDDGLSQHWQGKVYLNPPYGSEIPEWIEKLVNSPDVTEAIALLPARIDTVWFQPLYAYPMCNVKGRIQFENSPHHAPFPCVIVYIGDRVDAFIEVFKHKGPIMRRIG